MTPEREKRLKETARKRQINLTVVLENVHDPHNIGAVLRTSDSVGLKEIFVLYTDPRLDRDKLLLGKQSSSGARKWVDVHFYTDTKACFEHIKRNYEKIYATHLAKDSIDLFDMDFTQSMALIFGNEHSGISEETLEFVDGNFIIPQAGMVQSLNISVACAVTLYEAFRQRKHKGFYDNSPPSTKKQQKEIFLDYKQRHIDKVKKRFSGKIK